MTSGDTPDDTVGEDGEVIPPTKYGRTGPPCFNPKTKSWRLRYLPPAVKPSPKQSLFLGTTCRELFYGGAAGGGKLLNIITPIATLHGFKPIGDVHPGDYVFGADGQLHTVVGESEIVVADAWRLTFDTGEQIDAHDDHLWVTYTEPERQAVYRRTPEFREKRRASRPRRNSGNKSQAFREAVAHSNATRTQRTKLPPASGTTRTTAEIVASMKSGQRMASNHAIPVCAPLDFPEADLPLDPYVLGAYLGDGTTRTGQLTSMDPEIVDHIVEAGFPIHRVASKVGNLASTYTFTGLSAVVRDMGQTTGKHIPPEYLWASRDQRLALLQGLMDTDGGLSGRSVEFCNTNQGLTEGVAHLARSLGMKVTVREGRAKLYGVDCGPKWVVKFKPNVNVFRLSRKAEGLTLGTRTTNNYHYITNAERVTGVPMKCIQTSAADHQYLAGTHLIPTHNSVALLAAALQFADVPGYAALILRRNLTDLTQPGALISMSRQWLDGRSDCSYNANDRKWTFKGGGVIQFGYLSHIQDIGRYKGPLRPETEVLTDDGWTPICDVRVGDNVASFDPETRAAGMQPVSAVHEWDYDDDLVTVHQRTGVSFAATPDHTIWYRTAKLPELRRGRVGEVTATHGQIWIPRNGTWSDGEPPKPRVFAPTNLKGPKVPTLRFSPEDWVEFLGWYVSEGHLGIGKAKNLVGITQKMPEHQQRIEALLDRIGAKWHRYDNRHYSFSNGELADYLRDNCGKLAAGKRLPREVFGYAPEYRRILLDTLVDGDGSHYPDEGGKMLFVTTSEQLWNDVSELATRCGLTATTGTSPRMNFDGSERSEPALTYRVSITDRAGRDREVKQRDVHRERYTGKVHCLTVAPWHSIIIRYKGRVSVTGNTEYHYIGFDELSEFPVENMYTFMFSRLRRPAGLSRADIIQMYGQANDGLTLLDVPLRVRSASNPGGPGAGWAKKRFVDLQGRKAPFLPATFRDNPAIDDDEYLESLAMLDEVERRRLELGDWTIQEIPGALWKLADIQRHEWIRTDGTGMFDRVYIGLDPSVGEGAGDECGIVAGGILSSGRVVVLEDGSMSAHPDVWSARAVTMYTVLNATAIVVEQNNGAQLLRTQLRDAADRLGLPQPVVLLVTAKESKERRAGTVSAGYRSPEGNPLIVHAAGLAGGELEGQMVGWVPGQKQQTVKSPDRVDGLVWLLRGLLYPESIADMKQSVSTPGGLVDRYRSWG